MVGARKEITIASIEDARAALREARATGSAVTLASLPAAGCSTGPGWFAALVDILRSEFPEVAFDAVLDCADEPGAALGALRAGVKRVRFAGRPEAAARLADIARQRGAAIEKPI
jgi:hypothetical protein